MTRPVALSWTNATTRSPLAPTPDRSASSCTSSQEYCEFSVSLHEIHCGLLRSFCRRVSGEEDAHAAQ